MKKYNLHSIEWPIKNSHKNITLLILIALFSFFIMSFIYKQTESKLQNLWNTERYNELQIIGRIINQQIHSLKTQVDLLAVSDTIQNYDKSDNKAILNFFEYVSGNMPALIQIGLYDSKGFLKASNSKSIRPKLQNINNFEFQTKMLDLNDHNISLVSLIQNGDILFSSYSLDIVLNKINPSFAHTNLPIIVINDMGKITAGILSQNEPNFKLGNNISDLEPVLWEKIEQSYFGKFYINDTNYTFLKMKFDVFGEPRNYYILSYTKGDNINGRLGETHNILTNIIILAIILIIIIILLINYIKHNHLKLKNYHKLSNVLFDQDLSMVLVDNSGRVISINNRATDLLNIKTSESYGVNLPYILNLNADILKRIKIMLSFHDEYNGNVHIDQIDGFLKIRIIKVSIYYLVIFNDNRKLSNSLNELKFANIINEYQEASAVISLESTILYSNNNFITLLNDNNIIGKKLTDLILFEPIMLWDNLIYNIVHQHFWHGKVYILENSLLLTIKKTSSSKLFICKLERIDSIELKSNKFNDDGYLKLTTYFNEMPSIRRSLLSMLLIDLTDGENFEDNIILKISKAECIIEKWLPEHYKLFKYHLGQFILLMPEPNDKVHSVAADIINKLNEYNITNNFIGITSYSEGQTIEDFIINAKIALKRAQQSGNSICQAYTRDSAS